MLLTLLHLVAVAQRQQQCQIVNTKCGWSAQAYGRLDRLDDMMELLTGGEGMWSEAPGLANAQAVNAALGACARAGGMQEAIILRQRMVRPALHALYARPELGWPQAAACA